MKERVLLLYLRTGGGHISAARALKEAFERHEAVEAHLYNPLWRGRILHRWLIEKGYRRASSGLRTFWPFFYEFSKLPWFMDLSQRLFSLVFRDEVAAYVRRHSITRIVSVHFLHSCLINDVRRRVRERRIRICTVVTDPFTAHPIWFRRRYSRRIVFSERLRTLAIERYRFDPRRVVCMPIILRREFQTRLAAPRVHQLKEELGFDPDKRLVLLAGGGEGLSNGDRLLLELAGSSLDFELAIVCGNSDELYRKCRRAAQAGHDRKIAVYGFTDRMYDLMNICDVVVGKAGPATVMEVLLLRKPLIITSYMYGQERGNVEFVVENRLGFFVQRPAGVRDRVEHILGDEGNLEIIRENIARVEIRNGTDQIADYILDL